MMTDPQMLNALTQGSAKFEPTVGGKFSLFDGNVVGENLELVQYGGERGRVRREERSERRGLRGEEREKKSN